MKKFWFLVIALVYSIPVLVSVNFPRNWTPEGGYCGCSETMGVVFQIWLNRSTTLLSLITVLFLVKSIWFLVKSGINREYKTKGIKILKQTGGYLVLIVFIWSILSLLNGYGVQYYGF